MTNRITTEWSSGDDNLLQLAVWNIGKLRWVEVASLFSRKKASQCRDRWYNKFEQIQQSLITSSDGDIYLNTPNIGEVQESVLSSTVHIQATTRREPRWSNEQDECLLYLVRSHGGANPFTILEIQTGIAAEIFERRYNYLINGSREAEPEPEPICGPENLHIQQDQISSST